MIDQSSIEARNSLRHNLAAKMAAFEAHNGPVQTLPIRIGNEPMPAFRINCPDKPKAIPVGRVRKTASERKPRPNMVLKQRKIAVITELAGKGLTIEDIADQAPFTPKLTRDYVLNMIWTHRIPRGRQTDLEA